MRNNKSSTIFRSIYDHKKRVEEKRQTFIDKSFDEMDKEARLNFLESFLDGNVFIEDSGDLIINKRKDKFKKRYDKGKYQEINNKYKKLANLNFFEEIIESKNKTQKEMLNYTLKFKDLNKEIHHSNQIGGSKNESLYSLQQSYDYYKDVKKQGGKMHVLDLETIGGTNAEGIWRPEAITEFSLQTWDFKAVNNDIGIQGDRVKSHDVVIGLDIDKKILDEISTAIDNNTITSNERLNVTASRLSLYGHKDTKIRFDEELGYYVLDSFADTSLSQPKNIEAIKDGWNVLTNISKDMEQRKIKNGTSIRADHAAMANAMQIVSKDLKDNIGLLGGQNHISFDMPILVNEMRKLQKKYKGVEGAEIFDLDMDYESKKMLDLLGFTNNFYESFGVKDLFKEGMQGSKSVAGQEGLIKTHLPALAEKLTAHKASDDVYGLMGLLAMPSELLNNGQSVLDYMAESLGKIDYRDTELTANKHILRSKKGTSMQTSGKGYFNFASNSKGEIFTSSNHIISNGNVSKENFAVGFGLNKGAFYNINSIKKIELTDDLQDFIGEFTPEYGGKNLYHVELKMETSGVGKNSRLNDLTQNLFFKSQKELESFMSSYFDVIGEKDNNGNVKEIYKDQLEKIDIRELKKEAKNINGSDVNANYKKNTQELYDSAVEFSNKKILTSRAENSFLRNSDYNKIKKSLKLEEEILKIFKEGNKEKTSLSQREINEIMSSKIIKGEMALGIDSDLVAKMQNVVKDTLGSTFRENSPTQKVLDSSIDNYSSIMEFINRNRTTLSNITKELELKFEGNNNISNEYKREAFARAYDSVKREAASHIYRNNANTNGREASHILNDVKLQASLNEFKNMFEIDLSPISKTNNKYISVSSPEHLSNVLKLDLSSKSSLYSLINNATKMIYGKDKNTDKHKEKAVSELFNIVRKDNAFKNTEVMKQFMKQYTDENNNLIDGIGYHNIADTIIDSMREIKSKDRFAGIINIDHAFMKSLQGHDSFIKALNSNPVQSKIKSIVENTVDNLNVNIITSGQSEHAETVVQNVLMKHYMPDLELMKSNKETWNRSKEMLYDKGYKEMQTYLTNLIQNITSIDDTTLSVQDNGSLLIRHKGVDAIAIDNIPKIKFDNDSGVMYMQIGGQKFQYYRQAQLKSTNNGIEGDIGTLLNRLNKYDNKNLQSYIANYGEEAGIDKILGNLKGAVNDLRELPTINNFGGNDIDSNLLVDVQTGLKNILYDLFGEQGRHKQIVDNVEFMDRNLQKVLAEKFKRVELKDNNRLENLSPDVIRDVIKDVKHILQEVDKNGETSGAFTEVIEGLSFSGQEKKTASIVGVYGDSRPHNSALGSFDNGQRPTITQSGNAKYLRVNDIEEAGLMAGNIIDTTYMKKKATRKFDGVGETTTDIMLDISYVSTDALDVLLKTNFNEIIKDSSIENVSDSATKKTYDYIKSSINTYEQERIIDSRIHEKIYGLQSANTQKLSSTADILGYLKSADISQDEFYKQTKIINEHLGKVVLDSSGDLKYQSSVGTYVRRGESILKSKGFADLPTSFASKMQHGVFNFNFYNSNNIKLKDDEISKIINENKNLFMKNGNLIEQNDMPKVLLKLLEQKEIKSQWAVEDIAAIGYVKTMTSGAEKGMTDILYATTGQYDNNIKQVFKNMEVWDDVKSKILTNEAVDAIIKNANSKNKNIFKNTSFNSTEELKTAMVKERHQHSELLFGKILGNKTHILANDNVVGHGNFGAMYQGSLSRTIDLIAKKNNNDMDAAVDIIVNLINNGTGVKGEEDKFKFMENWSLSNKTIDKKGIGVIKNEQGRLEISNDFLTKKDQLSNLNSTKYNELLKYIDKNYLDSTNSDESLVRRDVWMYKTDEEGKESLQNIKEIVGAFKTVTLEDGRTLLLGAQTKENVKYVTDVESQTGVTDEYFTIKKHATELKKKKIDIEVEMNKESNAEKRSVLQKQLNKIKQELREAEEALIPYEGTVKITRIGDQELSILSRVAITQSHVDKMNELMETNQIDESILKINSLRDRVVLRDGKLVGTNDINLGNVIINKGSNSGNGLNNIEVGIGKGERVLDRFIKKIKDNQWFDEISDVELTKEMLEDEKYAKYKEIYKDITEIQNKKIGLEKAEQLYQAKSSFEAMNFNNNSYKDKKAVENLEKAGFKITNINDINFDTDNIVTENLLVDLGENFANKHEQRYVAVPGTGKSVGDEDLKRKVHTNLSRLQYKYNEYMDVQGSGKENTEHLVNKVKNTITDIKKSVESELLDKNGMGHAMSKVDISTATYRNKLSGVISSEFNDNYIEKAIGKGITTIDSSNSDITKKAMIEGRSIADWEKGGSYFDYTFVSTEQMRNMGYFDKKTLKQYGFEKEEQMMEHLQIHGTNTIYDRYPNTRTGSMTLTRTFLDPSLQPNQMKASITIMGKANADHDGDSATNFIERYVDSKKRSVDGAYYNRVKEIAEKNLQDNNIENTAINLKEAALKTNMIDEVDYDYFLKQDTHFAMQAITENKKWADWGHKTIIKDSLKNTKIGDMTHASTVADGYSDLFSKNAFASVSQLPNLNEFNALEEQSNKIINQAQELHSQLGIDFAVKAGHSGKALANEQKDWDTFLKTKDIRENGSAQIMDKAMAIFESAKDNKLIDESTLKSIQSIAVQRVTQDKYVQETIAKTGLASVGNVNLALNSIKLTTQLLEQDDTSKIKFTNFIWDTLGSAEQKIISDKKRPTAGFDDELVTNFSNALKDAYSKNKNKRQNGRDNLMEWINTNSKGVFEDAFNDYGRDLFNKQEYAEIQNNGNGAKEVEKIFKKYIEDTSENEMFISANASFNAVGKNGSHADNLRLANPFYAGETEYGSLKSSWLRNTLGADESKIREYNALKETSKQNADLALKKERSHNAVVNSSANQVISEGISETVETAMKHTPKIPMTGNGLGMAVLGTAAGLMISGYASGNPLKDKSAEQVSQEQTAPKQRMSVPQFMEQGGMVTGNSQGGYVINLQADTKKGKKYMKRMMAQAAEASVGGSVSVNMNLRNVSQNGITDRDIENFMDRHL